MKLKKKKKKRCLGEKKRYGKDILFELKSGPEFKKENRISLGSSQNNGHGKHNEKILQSEVLGVIKDHLYSYPFTQRLSTELFSAQN